MATIAPTPISGSFNNVLFQFFKTPGIEGFEPFVYSDNVGIPTLGVGFALATGTVGMHNWTIRPGYKTDLANAGISLTTAQLATLDVTLTNAVDALNGVGGAKNPFPIWRAGLPVTANVLDWTITDLQAQSLFDGILPNYQKVVKTWLGNDAVYNTLQSSQEMEECSMRQWKPTSILESTRTMVKKFIQLTAMLGAFCVLPGCASNLTGPEYKIWQEEVKLSDGRVIVVTQKKRCKGAYTGGNYADCIAREAWLTMNLSEFSAQEIVWHEKLDPIILNIDKGHLYVVGFPPTGLEFRLYGKPQPPYIGFIFEDGQWNRIPFEKIPKSIYDTNMLLDSFPPTGITFLTLIKKEDQEMNGRPTIDRIFRRIEPTYRSN